jgi:Flp pilus assembly protein TadD
MFKKTLLAFGLSVAVASAMANTPDDFFLEKIRFIRDQAQSQSAYQAGVRIFIQSVDSSDGVLMGELGRALMRLQDYDNAQAVLISATRVAPSNGDAQADLSFVSALRKDCVTSRYAYDQAAAIDPKLVDQRHVKRGRSMCPGA